MKVVLVALLIFIGGYPDLVGLATDYGPPAFNQGDTMANGQPLDLRGMTIAVDVSLQHKLNSYARILTECGQVYVVQITDTGRLYRAGKFRRGIRGEVLRYWPVIEDWGDPVLQSTPPYATWLDDVSYPIVVDFPSGFRDSIPCKTAETMKVMVWF